MGRAFFRCANGGTILRAGRGCQRIAASFRRFSTSTLSGCLSSPTPEADAIRAAFEQHGELSAAIELRRLFPGITDNVQALACARTIAGWKPLPAKKLRSIKLPRTD